MKFTRTIKTALSAAVVGILALGLVSTSAFASTTTTSFTVTAGLGNTCTVSATNMAFYTIPTTSASTATSTISVTCTNHDIYIVGLSAGFSTVETARFMEGVTTSNHLSYGLYSDSGHTLNWGTAAGQVPGVGNGSAQNLTVYGQITAAQAAAAPVDNYNDTITVTVTY
jgi:spore coat protein U-like protein